MEEKIERHQSEQQDTQEVTSQLEDVQKANTSLMEELKQERHLTSSLLKKEKKKLREMHEVKDVAVQFDYIVPHSGVCVCVCVCVCV